MAEYIEREAAIDAIMKVYVRTAGYKARERVFEAEEAVHRLSVADVAPVVHGRWIDRGDYVTTAYGSLPVNRCSECHMDVTLEDFDSYCPNCGARMDGDSNG